MREEIEEGRSCWMKRPLVGRKPLSNLNSSGNATTAYADLERGNLPHLGAKFQSARELIRRGRTSLS